MIPEKKEIFVSWELSSTEPYSLYMHALRTVAFICWKKSTFLCGVHWIYFWSADFHKKVPSLFSMKNGRFEFQSGVTTKLKTWSPFKKRATLISIAVRWGVCKNTEPHSNTYFLPCSLASPDALWENSSFCVFSSLWQTSTLVKAITLIYQMHTIGIIPGKRHGKVFK